jgi:hypothetical protein
VTRDFAPPLGVLARTDRARARILAEMGRILPLEATAPPDPDRGGWPISSDVAGRWSRCDTGREGAVTMPVSLRPCAISRR